MSASRELIKVTSLRSLRGIYEKKVKESSAVGRDGIHPSSLEENLDSELKLIQNNLRSGRYRFTPYREVLKLRGGDRCPRTISVPTARDRIAHRALMEVLHGTFDIRQMERPQRKIKRVIDSLRDGKFDGYIRLDIVDFYPSVDHEVLMSSIRHKIKKPEIISAISAAVSTPTLSDSHPHVHEREARGIPQGLSVSNILAELVMQKVDSLHGEDGRMLYVRYVDDILILCRLEDACRIADLVIKSVEEKKLRVHPIDSGGKSSVGKISEGFDYLGYVFDANSISVRIGSRRNMENSIFRVFTRNKYDLMNPKAGLLGDDWVESCAKRFEWYINLLVVGCVHEGRKHGWMHYFSDINDISLLKGFDRQIAKCRREFDTPDSVEIHTFVAAYWAINRPNSRRRIVPNYDNFDVSEKSKILHEVFLVKESKLSRMSESEISRTFSKKLRRATVELEKDIGAVYRG